MLKQTWQLQLESLVQSIREFSGQFFQLLSKSETPSESKVRKTLPVSEAFERTAWCGRSEGTWGMVTDCVTIQRWRNH